MEKIKLRLQRGKLLRVTIKNINNQKEYEFLTMHEIVADYNPQGKRCYRFVVYEVYCLTTYWYDMEQWQIVSVENEY